MPRFELQPDLTVLEKHGYLYDSDLSVESIWTEEQRVDIEKRFRELAESNGLLDHYDTLLYIILVRHDDAYLELQQTLRSYEEHVRVKELAQLLSLYEPRRNYQPNLLKISTRLDTFKLTDPILLEWFGNLVKEAVEKGKYVPSKLGWAVTDFAKNEKGEVLANGATLDYRAIAYYASQKIRKPTVRERNRALAIFLLYVYDFLQRETTLCVPAGVRFSESQLTFLYKLAVLFQWLPEDRPGDVAEDKDYLYTLFLNHIKLHN